MNKGMFVCFYLILSLMVLGACSDSDGDAPIEVTYICGEYYVEPIRSSRSVSRRGGDTTDLRMVEITGPNGISERLGREVELYHISDSSIDSMGTTEEDQDKKESKAGVSRQSSRRQEWLNRVAFEEYGRLEEGELYCLEGEYREDLDIFVYDEAKLQRQERDAKDRGGDGVKPDRKDRENVPFVPGRDDG